MMMPDLFQGIGFLLLTKNETWQPQHVVVNTTNTNSVSTSSSSTVTYRSEEDLMDLTSIPIINVDSNMEVLWSEFVIPWDKIPEKVLKACESGISDKRIITDIIHVVINAMRDIKTNIPSKAFKLVAKKVIDRYPVAFRDQDDDGTVLGDGSHSMFSSLQDRNNYLNRPHKRSTESLPNSI